MAKKVGQRPAPDLRAAVRVAGERLRAEREARGWTGTELADRAGVDQSAISKYERGERFPAAPVRARLEEAFGWPAGRIVRLTGIAEEATTLEDVLAGRPYLTDADRGLVLRLIEHLEATNRHSRGQ